MDSALVWRLPDGIVCTILTKPHIELTDAMAVFEARLRLTNSGRSRTVTDLRQMRSASREARAFAASPRSTAHTEAIALLVGSLTTRVIASFFLGFNRPPHPIKVFTDPDAALRWLRELPDIAAAQRAAPAKFVSQD